MRNIFKMSDKEVDNLIKQYTTYLKSQGRETIDYYKLAMQINSNYYKRQLKVHSPKLLKLVDLILATFIILSPVTSIATCITKEQKNFSDYTLSEELEDSSDSAKKNYFKEQLNNILSSKEFSDEVLSHINYLFERVWDNYDNYKIFEPNLQEKEEFISLLLYAIDQTDEIRLVDVNDTMSDDYAYLKKYGANGTNTRIGNDCIIRAFNVETPELLKVLLHELMHNINVFPLLNNIDNISNKELNLLYKKNKNLFNRMLKDGYATECSRYTDYLGCRFSS